MPIERILIETDSPWCGIRPSHAGSKLFQTQFPSVKKKQKWTKEQLIDGRNESCQIRYILVTFIMRKRVAVLYTYFYSLQASSGSNCCCERGRCPKISRYISREYSEIVFQ